MSAIMYKQIKKHTKKSETIAKNLIRLEFEDYWTNRIFGCTETLAYHTRELFKEINLPEEK